jgi:uncharacterized GH25 family protein
MSFYPRITISVFVIPPFFPRFMEIVIMKRAVVAIVMLMLPGLAYAHDFWVERGKDAFVLQYGHRGGEALVIDPAKIKSIRCLGPNNAVSQLPLDSTIGKQGAGPISANASGTRDPLKKVNIPATCSAVSVFFYGGYWSLTPDGEKNLPKSKCTDAVKSWESRQYAKWVDSHSPLANNALGDDFEIIPVTDLSQLKKGDKATFRVLLRGKPVSGAIAAMEHKPLGETDSEGQVRLRIRASDFESITVSLRQTVSSPNADAQVFEASLSFEVSK